MEAASLYGHGTVVARLSHFPAFGPEGSGDPPATPRGHAQTDPSAELAGVRVLVVEDESLLAMSLVATLEELGAEVCGTAASSEEAVRRARALRPGLAIVDIRLRDGETGVDAARVMVEEMGVAIVFATAHTDPGLAARMAAVPGAARLIKPYDAADLLDAARRVLGRA